MTNRECTNAILHYQKSDRLPIIHFGYWEETLEKWRDEGHITAEEAAGWSDGNAFDSAIAAKLGFDFDWQPTLGSGSGLFPAFEWETVEERPDGSSLIRSPYGVTMLQIPGAGSIPAEVDHMLKDRKSWEEEFKHRFVFRPERVPNYTHLKSEIPENPRGLHLGSLFGTLRDIIGIVDISYLYADDEELYKEIIDTSSGQIYACAEAVLKQGVQFDYAHFWEDICFKNGPLISPDIFAEYVAPHYKRITDLCRSYGIDVISLDCDGFIDSLLPIWLENGVNTMFPIEVGTWEASIAPWREKYGKQVLGVGGMNKNVFAYDKTAVDAEIERLRPLIALGGYIPCPDHRIPPDALWENVQYYCDKLRKIII